MGYIGKVKVGDDTHLVASTLFGTCDTAAGTQTKAVSFSNNNTVNTIEEGVTIYVKFTYSNTHATPKLQVGSATAKNIYAYGTTKPGTTVQATWSAGSVVGFTYDGSAWIMNNYKVSDINHNTDENVKQTNDTSNNDYRVLLSNSANNNEETSGIKKSANLIFNPSTKTLTTSNGYFKLLNGKNTVNYTKEEDSGDTKYPVKWYCNLGRIPTDGDTVTITVPTGGGNTNGVYLSIEEDISTKYKPISISKATKLTTHFAEGEIITLVYRASGETNAIYPIDGGTETTTVSGGCWSVLNYYNTNTDTKVRQSLTNTSANRPILLAYSGNTTTTTNVDNICYRDNDFYYNPSSNDLYISGNMHITNTVKGLYGKDSASREYALIRDNGSNLWIGAANGTGVHHTGSTYISSGWNGTSGNSSIYISVPTLTNNTWTQSSKLVLHEGNYSSYALPLNGGTMSGSIAFDSTTTSRLDTAKNLTNEGVSTPTHVVGLTTNWAKFGYTTIAQLKSTMALNNVTNNKQVKGLSSGTTSGHIVTWGSDGYTVADSGYTIATSVPANAVFTDTWRNVQVNGTQKLGTGTGTGALNFKNGTNTTVSYDSGVKINATDTKNTAGSNNNTFQLYLIGATDQTTESNGVQTYSNSGVYMTDGNLNLGGAGQEGTLTLHTGDAQDASTGVLYQASTPWNINHYLPTTSSVTEDSYLLNQENLIHYFHYYGNATITGSSSGQVIATIPNEDYILTREYEDVYFVIYFKDKENNFKNVHIISRSDTDVVPPETAGATGSVFSLTTVSVPSHLYLRTLICHLKYTNARQWELIQDYQTEVRFDIPTISSGTTASASYSQYTTQKSTDRLKWVKIDRIEIWVRGNL